jgi:bifunctional non-homologous end joining protein LigD
MSKTAQASTLTVDGRTIEIPHPDKVLFPDDGVTKEDLARYYERIAPAMLPHLRDRPLHLQRFPDGIEGEEVQQKQAPRYFPDWVRRVQVPRKRGGSVDHVVCDDAATLVYLAGQACTTPHVWLSRADRLDHPDRLVFDLDPPDDDRGPLRLAAHELRSRLEALTLPALLMATGGRGLHVVTPLDRGADFDTVRAFARRVAAVLAADYADRLTVEQRKQNRQGRLYLDTGRNAYAQTAVAPYAVRARAGAPVAVPLEWTDLDDPGFRPNRHTMRDVSDLVERRPDPWAAIDRAPGSIEQAQARLSD